MSINQTRILALIAETRDSSKLRRLMENAERLGETDVYEAAFDRLVNLMPTSGLDPLDREYWRMINAFEHVLRLARGKSVPMTRTRQKVEKLGAQKALEEFAPGKPETEGFALLIEQGRPDLTSEAIILRNIGLFETGSGSKLRASMCRP